MYGWLQRPTFSSSDFLQQKKGPCYAVYCSFILTFVALVTLEIIQKSKKKNQKSKYIKNHKKLDGVAPLIVDPPPMKLHQ